MKALLLALLLALPAAAHPSHDNYFPNTLEASEVDTNAYINNFLNHGLVTAYGYPEVMYAYDIEAREYRLVVPAETLEYYRFPYNELVTTW